MKVNKKSTIEIEEYARILPQYYGIIIPKTLKKYLDITPFSSFIDCGCGDGALLYVLKSLNYLKNKKVYGVDLSTYRISLVKKIDPHIHAIVDSAESLKRIKTSSIDFLASTHVIEHVDDKKMPKAVERVLKKNGIAYIATVFKKWYGWYYYRRDGKWVMDVTHLREYMHDYELLGHIDKKKFEILEVQKSQLSFPIIDFFVRRLFINHIIKDRKTFTDNPIFRIMRQVKIPIPGYYNWEIVLKKR